MNFFTIYWDFSLLSLVAFFLLIVMTVVTWSNYGKDNLAPYIISSVLLVVVPVSILFVLPTWAVVSKKSRVLFFLILAVLSFMVALGGYRNLPASVDVNDLLLGGDLYGETSDLVLSEHERVYSERSTFSRKATIGVESYDFFESFVPIRQVNGDSVAEKHLFLLQSGYHGFERQKAKLSVTEDEVSQRLLGRVRSLRSIQNETLGKLMMKFPKVKHDDLIVLAEVKEHDNNVPMFFLGVFSFFSVLFFIVARLSAKHWSKQD